MKRATVITLLIIHLLLSQVSAQVITLQQCMDSALTWNPQIKEASDAADLAESSIALSRSAGYPFVYSENSAGFSDEFNAGNDYRTASAGLYAEQLLWQKNKTGFSTEQAKKSKVASEADLESRIREINLSVQLAYFSCLQQQMLLKIAGENVARAGLFVDYAKERYKAGTGRKPDILKAGSDLSEALFEKNAFLHALERARNELSMVSGIAAENLSILDSTWIEDLPPDTETPFSVPQNACLSQYPEYRSVSNLVYAQEAKINRVRAEQYPGLLMNAGYQWTYNPVFKDQNTWYTTLTLRWTLFKGNENHIRVQSEIIRKSILEKQAEEVEIFFRKELANREISLAEAVEKIQLTRELISTTAANLETATEEFKAGTGSMLELVDARAAFFRARQNHIMAITEYRIAGAQLERLTGTTIQTK